MLHNIIDAFLATGKALVSKVRDEDEQTFVEMLLLFFAKYHD